jgi:DNA primase
MPGIDYREARQRVRLAEVLQLLDFEPASRHGEEVRGPCPVHRSRTAGSRSFAAHLGKGVWKCFGCASGGNVLDLWAAVTRQPLHAAVIELYARLGREVPWLPRRPCGWARPGTGANTELEEQGKRTMPEP